MAVAFDRKIGENTGASQVSIPQTSGTLTAGEFYAIWVACDNTAGTDLPTVASVTLNVTSETFTVIASHASTSTTANAATRGFIIIVPSSVGGSGNIEVAFSASPSKCVGLAAAFTGASSTVVSGSAASSNTSNNTMGVTASAGDLLLGLGSSENNIAMNVDTTYTAPAGDGSVFTTGGGAAANVSVIGGYRIATGGGAAADAWTSVWSNDGGECVVGLEAAATGTPIAGSDTGSGADAKSVLTAAITGTETATGTDVRSTLVATLPTAADTGTSVESGSVSVPVAGSDTGVFVDVKSVLTANITGTDTGTGADINSARTAALTGADTGSGTDTGVADASVAGTDTGTSADAGSVTVGGGTTPSGSDTGSGADTGSVQATLSGTDTGTSVDTGSVAASVAGTDTATGVDVRSTLVANTGGTDTGTGTDIRSALTANVTGSDTGTAVDAGSIAVTGGQAISGADTGMFVESASVVALSSRNDTGLFTETTLILREQFVLLPGGTQEHQRPVYNAVDRVGNTLNYTLYRIDGTWRQGQNLRADQLEDADLVYRGGYEHVIYDPTVRAELISAGYAFEQRFV